MKKRLAILLLLATSASLQASELRWLTDYGDAMRLARTSARPLLLVIHRDGLLPNSRDRLSPGQAAEPSHDILRAYVLCQIDASSGEGQRLAEAFRVSEYPHSVIIDKTTKKILYSKAGPATHEALKVTLTKYQGEAPRQEMAVTQPQTTVGSPSRAYGGRTFSFRQPAACNT